MSGISIGSDAETTNTVTLENVEEVRTRKVGDNGQVYVGQDYGGKEILLAFRVEDEQNDENDESGTEESHS